MLLNLLSSKFKHMSPIFKCLICRKDIERSTKTYWIKKGHLLCSTCLDNIEKSSLRNSDFPKNFNKKPSKEGDFNLCKEQRSSKNLKKIINY